MAQIATGRTVINSETVNRASGSTAMMQAIAKSFGQMRVRVSLSAFAPSEGVCDLCREPFGSAMHDCGDVPQS